MNNFISEPCYPGRLGESFTASQSTLDFNDGTGVQLLMMTDL
jgi:hypothetical protein